MSTTAETTDTSNKPFRRLREDEEQSVAEFLAQFGDQASVKCNLIRLEPKYDRRLPGVNLKGSLGTWEDLLTAEEIEERFGGGRYRLRVMLPNSGGKFSYKTQKTFEIAGLPNLDQYRDQLVSENSNHGGTAAERAMDMAEKLVAEAQVRNRELEARTNQGMDTGTIEQIVGPYRIQIDQLMNQVSNLQQQLVAKMSEKPDTSQTDNVMSLWKESNSDHSSRISEIGQKHDSELRSLRELHREEVRRIEDRHDRALSQIKDDHRREIKTLESTHRQALDSTKNSFEMRIQGLNDSLSRLTQEKAEARQEVVTLRAKKEQTPLDQITQLVALKNGLASLTGKDDEDDEKQPAWLQAAESMRVPDLISNLAQRVGSAPGDQKQQAGPEMVIVRRADGSEVTVPKSVVMAQQARARAAAQQSAEPQIDRDGIQKAVVFMENAFRNSVEPATFARSAQSMIPGDILAMLKQKGPDDGAEHFLDHYAELEVSSPFSSVAGRQWVRKVVKFLLKGHADDEPPAPEPEPTVMPAVVPPLEDVFDQAFADSVEEANP